MNDLSRLYELVALTNFLCGLTSLINGQVGIAILFWAVTAASLANLLANIKEDQ